MTGRPTTFKGRRRGIAAILALSLLAIMVAMAISLFSVGSMNTAQAANFRAEYEARVAAESGMSLLTRELENCRTLACYRGQALLTRLGDQLKDDLNGTTNLHGGTVSYTAAAITVPAITLDATKSFTVQITLSAYDTLKVQVTGSYTTGSGATGSVQRIASMSFHPTGSPAFGYGLYSQGPITIGMNEDIIGVDSPVDGSIYSAAGGTAITIGSGVISGDVCYSAPDATVSLDRVAVGGQVLQVPPIAPPAIDRSPYIPLATNIIDSQADVDNHVGAFSNIRIKANTNPVFSNNVTVLGVVYIEAPNNVQFTNNVTFVGVMVGGDPPAGSPDSASYVSIVNDTAFWGVERLPAGSQYDAVRKLAGTTVLAPGFTFEFKNNFTSMDGVVAVKNMIVKNNLDAVLSGSILAYGNAGMTFKNNEGIQVDRTVNSGVAPGFVGYGQVPIKPDPDTYTEH
jgi:hypothetical protein